MLTTKQKIALARTIQSMVMLGRNLLGKGATAQVKRNGLNWSLDLREGIDFSIWLLGSFEPETVRCYNRIIRPKDVVLDIGANIGAHTLPMAMLVGEYGRVIAFEPTDFAYAKLSCNCALNPDLSSRISNLQTMLVDVEMGDKPTPNIYSSWPLKVEAGSHSLHRGQLKSTSGAKAGTLDAVVCELGLSQVNCVKLDIDGHECSMLRGARKTLSKWKPTIIMELAPYALREQGGSLEELVSIFISLGYELFEMTTDKKLPLDSFALDRLVPEGASVNVLARSASGKDKI